MASTNKFDKQVLDSALATSRAKFAKQESIAAPKTDDETQEFEVTSTEYTIHMNGKNFQLIEENGSLHFVDKNHGTGITIDKNGDTYIISGPGGNGNACAGRLLINSRGGQLVKSGNFTAEYTANSSNSVNGEGSSSSTTKKGNEDSTSTAAQNGSADAKSETCYGDNTCEVFGDFNVNATNIHLQATDTLYINADSKIVITAGKDGGGSMEIHAGELLHKVQTLRDEISSAHIRDGVAVTKFLYWIKNSNIRKLDEIKVEKKLESFRKQNKNYLFPSFSTIAGSGPNGAIIHYRSNKKSNRKLNKDHLLLVDSGGQYKWGTTDITRTISFSDPSKKTKELYTRVLKGHIAVAMSKIDKLKNGNNIDKLARKSLNSINLDYRHGTGHGVGFFMNVHEGPQSISKNNFIKLKKGMIVSNEPGIYLENKLGIRIENLVYIDGNNKNLFFKNLTFAPLEKDLIDENMLTKIEKDYIFSYHLETYSKLSAYLNNKERKWLAKLIQ